MRAPEGGGKEKRKSEEEGRGGTRRASEKPNEEPAFLRGLSGTIGDALETAWGETLAAIERQWGTTLAAKDAEIATLRATLDDKNAEREGIREEFRARGVELLKTQEELDDVTRELKEKKRELGPQKRELRARKRELRARSGELSAQKRELRAQKRERPKLISLKSYTGGVEPPKVGVGTSRLERRGGNGRGNRWGRRPRRASS